MNYTIVTTPRTGSTMMTAVLYNLARQWWGSKNNLDEYFTFSPLYRRKYDVIDNTISSLFFEKTESNITYSAADYEEISLRLQMLKNDSNYTFKMFSTDVTPDILDFVSNNYNIIYLERRNKIEQILSLNNMIDKRMFHYKSAHGTINQFKYYRKGTLILLDMIDRYYEIKNKNPGLTIYYEDFLSKGGREQALIQCLNLPHREYQPLNWEYVPTPYISQPENLISNLEQWHQDLPDIMRRLSQHDVMNNE